MVSSLVGALVVGTAWASGKIVGVVDPEDMGESLCTAVPLFCCDCCCCFRLCSLALGMAVDVLVDVPVAMMKSVRCVHG